MHPIDVGPPKSQQLAAAHSGHRRGPIQHALHPPQLVIRDFANQRLQFLGLQEAEFRLTRRVTRFVDTRTTSSGREIYYAKFWCRGRQVWRKLGAKREAGSRYGLTRSQAEAELRRAMLGSLSGVRRPLTVPPDVRPIVEENAEQ